MTDGQTVIILFLAHACGVEVILFILINRAVATSQVIRYLPDHFFPSLPVSIIRKRAEPVAIEFEITVSAASG